MLCSTCGAEYDPEEVRLQRASPAERKLLLRLRKLRAQQAQLEEKLAANVLEQAQIEQKLGVPHE